MKVFRFHNRIIAFDQAAVAVGDTDDLRIEQFIRGAGNAADTSVESGAVAAAGKDSDSSFHNTDPFLFD